jgi:N-acetylmuramoyl-L-alanine amidase
LVGGGQSAVEKEIQPVIIQVAGQEIKGVLMGDRTYAPVRALAEALGKTVTWDGQSNKVVIS